MSLSQLFVALLAGGVVVLASVAAARAADRVGLPSLLIFLALGVVIGEDGLGCSSRTPTSPRSSAPPRWR